MSLETFITDFVNKLIETLLAGPHSNYLIIMFAVIGFTSFLGVFFNSIFKSFWTGIFYIVGGIKWLFTDAKTEMKYLKEIMKRWKKDVNERKM